MKPEVHRIPVKHHPDLAPLQILGLLPMPSQPLTTKAKKKVKKARAKQAHQSRKANRK